MQNQYQFVSRWRVDGTCGEVADVLGDPLALAQWWPSVYLDVREVLHTKGWLPYTIRWELEQVESRYPYGFGAGLAYLVIRAP